jgi:YidC/Oxa1 family membrane protein insertase
MTAIFHTIISVPLYNGLVFLMHILPFFSAGSIIIIFTIIIKLILLPLSIKASKAQMEMKKTEKDLEVIRNQYTDKQEQSQKIMDYYKQNGINPFASFLVLLVQLPILIGLYRVFFHSGLPVINTSMLYSFVTAPLAVNMVFLGLINLAGKSWILALLAGVTTYFQVNLATPAGNTQGQTGMAKAMATNMKYFLPALMTFIAYTISSAIALYLITSNLFAIAQEMYIKKKYHKAVFVE